MNLRSQPSPEDLTSTRWDVVVVGAGHNGLTAAAYLARAGKRVLVLERRDVIGGACTIEEPWPGYRLSPCAYVVGLLHERVIKELSLDRQLKMTLFDPQLYIPGADGSVYVEWLEEERTIEDLQTWAPDQVEGFRALSRFERQIKEALRPGSDDDLWLRIDPPSREEIEERLGRDPDMVEAVFEDSIETYLGRFFTDQRVVDALAGQGVIGSAASPRDPGTGWIHLHHSLGTIDGRSGAWAFVHGGIGMVSLALADAALEAGAVIATEVEVARIIPGQGVELDSGVRIHAPVVVSNADPRRTLALLGDEAPSTFESHVESVPMVGATAKVNYALSSIPAFRHDVGAGAMVSVGSSVAGLDRSAAAARRGDFVAEDVWAELYLQTAHDPTVAPAGKHVLSCFVQYVPYAFADGTWDTRRDEVGAAVTKKIEEAAPGFSDLIENMEVSGPPDIEAKLGLTGGHIFQGECLPSYMWDRRVPYRTGADGVYLCGAGTHPGGSVIAVNGRNAAMCVLADLE